NRDRYLKLTKREGLDPEQLEEYNYHLRLGEGMLEGYFAPSLRVDKDWEPVGVEVPFSVPIMWPKELDPADFINAGKVTTETQRLTLEVMSDTRVVIVQMISCDPRDGIIKPVFYNGRIDLIMRRL